MLEEPRLHAGHGPSGSFVRAVNRGLGRPADGSLQPVPSHSRDRSHSYDLDDDARVSRRYSDAAGVEATRQSASAPASADSLATEELVSPFTSREVVGFRHGQPGAGVGLSPQVEGVTNAPPPGGRRAHFGRQVPPHSAAAAPSHGSALDLDPLVSEYAMSHYSTYGHEAAQQQQQRQHARQGHSQHNQNEEEQKAAANSL